MIRPFDIVCLALVVAVSITLYGVKYRAQSLEEDVARLHLKIGEEQDAIGVLRAEWGYLTKPDRLQSLAGRHLSLRPLEASQIVTFGDLPLSREDFYEPGRRMLLGGYAGEIPGKVVR